MCGFNTQHLNLKDKHPRPVLLHQEMGWGWTHDQCWCTKRWAGGEPTTSAGAPRDGLGVNPRPVLVYQEMGWGWTHDQCWCTKRWAGGEPTTSAGAPRDGLGVNPRPVLVYQEMGWGWTHDQCSVVHWQKAKCSITTNNSYIWAI